MIQVIKLSTAQVMSTVYRDIKYGKIREGSRIFPVLRGGYPIALMLAYLNSCVIVDDLSKADVIVDDIIASGATREKYAELSTAQFYAPYTADNCDVWYVFPWEKSKEDDATEILSRMLQHSGIAVTDANLRELESTFDSFAEAVRTRTEEAQQS